MQSNLSVILDITKMLNSLEKMLTSEEHEGCVT